MPVEYQQFHTLFEGFLKGLPARIPQDLKLSEFISDIGEELFKRGNEILLALLAKLDNPNP